MTSSDVVAKLIPLKIGTQVNSLGAYLIYLCVSNHFKNKFNMKKYGLNIKTSEDAFVKRKDRVYFERVCKKYNSSELFVLYLSNILDDKSFVGDFVSIDGIARYEDLTKALLNINYVYRNDIINLDTWCRDNNKKFKSLFEITNSDHPIIIKMYLKGLIRLETLVILNSFLKFTKKFDKNLTDNIWLSISQKIINYSDILNINNILAGDICKSIINKS